MTRPGLFITFEGIEGSGKTTQARALAQFLRSRHVVVVETREPGGTTVAEGIREVFLRNDDLVPECEAALVFAARSQHVTKLILPALARGEVVICDRFTDSTLAYQGFGRGLPLDELRPVARWAAKGLSPDVTLLLDLPVTEGLRRRRTGGDENRLDRETVAFHERVRQGFLTLSYCEPTRFRVFDGWTTVEALTRELKNLKSWFPKDWDIPKGKEA